MEDKTEQDIIEEADCERGEILGDDPLLEKLKFDSNLDLSLEEQKEASMKFLREYRNGLLETARAPYQAKLLAPARAEDDECGSGVAVHYGTIVVGCGGSGKTHVFLV
ncbi:hypothetical protein ACHAWF_004509 [Thalassiosira exigua]